MAKFNLLDPEYLYTVGKLSGEFSGSLDGVSARARDLEKVVREMQERINRAFYRRRTVRRRYA